MCGTCDDKLAAEMAASKYDTMPDDVKARVMAGVSRRGGLTAMQAIADDMISHEDAMVDIARDYDFRDSDSDAAAQRIARSRARSEIIQHQRDFYALQGKQVSEARMAEVADEIVADMFGD
jgi:hypothetical protein